MLLPDLSPAAKAHILASMPRDIQEAYKRATRKAMVALAEPNNGRLKLKRGEILAMEVVGDAFDEAASRRRVDGMTVVRERPRKTTGR